MGPCHLCMLLLWFLYPTSPLDLMVILESIPFHSHDDLWIYSLSVKTAHIFIFLILDSKLILGPYRISLSIASGMLSLLSSLQCSEWFPQDLVWGCVVLFWTPVHFWNSPGEGLIYHTHCSTSLFIFSLMTAHFSSHAYSGSYQVHPTQYPSIHCSNVTLPLMPVQLDSDLFPFSGRGDNVLAA